MTIHGKEGKNERFSEHGNDKIESENRTIYIEGKGRGKRGEGGGKHINQCPEYQRISQ